MDQVRRHFEPLKKEWMFHFMISPKTSSIEKPEWYFEQTLIYIYENIDRFEEKVKLDKPSNLNVKHVFILSMVELVMRRLNKDMDRVTENIEEDDIRYEPILIHTYNEAIQFTKTIRRLLGDSCDKIDIRHDIMGVFSNQILFERIIDIEWTYADGNLKEIISSPDRWDPILEGDFVDAYRIPKCVDLLLMMNQSITERVECFKQLDCQFQLIDLQCHLFNKFLNFLKRSSESSSSKTPKSILSDILFFSSESTIDLTRILKVLNGVNFLRMVLRERSFIPANITDELNCILIEKCNKLIDDYSDLFKGLIRQVVGIYECVDGDLSRYLDFIRPKLCSSLYDIIKDETSKIHERYQSKHLLKNM